jgi:hypothetical protein
VQLEIAALKGPDPPRKLDLPFLARQRSRGHLDEAVLRRGRLHARTRFPGPRSRPVYTNRGTWRRCGRCARLWWSGTVRGAPLASDDRVPGRAAGHCRWLQIRPRDMLDCVCRARKPRSVHRVGWSALLQQVVLGRRAGAPAPSLQACPVRAHAGRGNGAAHACAGSPARGSNVGVGVNRRGRLVGMTHRTWCPAPACDQSPARGLGRILRDRRLGRGPAFPAPNMP